MKFLIKKLCMSVLIFGFSQGALADKPLNPHMQGMLKAANEAMPVLKSIADEINYQRSRIWYSMDQNNCNFNFQSTYKFIETTYRKSAVYGPNAKPPWRARETLRASDERVQMRGRELIALGEKILSDLNDLRTLAETAQSKWCIPGPPKQSELSKMTSELVPDYTGQDQDTENDRD
jgi:hypothetical protein